MNLEVKYLGLTLKNPIIVASSPFTSSIVELKKVEAAGAGAVVLKSIFEEQIVNEIDFMGSYSDYPEATDYLQRYAKDDLVNSHLDLIKEGKKQLTIPIIASINCYTAGSWLEYAKSIEDAGADALELNIALLSEDLNQPWGEIEEQYLDIVSMVTSAVTIPVAVKLGSQFTNIAALCGGIYNRNAHGVVMFNRFFAPDIDINKRSLVSSAPLSANSELRNVLRMIGICAPQLPKLNIAASTGIHSGSDVIKAILAGADAVQICSALYISGLQVINEMNEFIAQWMEQSNFNSISDFKGLLSYNKKNNEKLYRRLQYMRFFPSNK